MQQKNYPITPSLREELKIPLGELVKDSSVNYKLLGSIFRRSGVLTVCVGDCTTEKIHAFGFSPNLEIVDNYEKRNPRPSRAPEPSTTKIETVNPAGTISFDALQKIRACLEMVLKNRRSTIRLEVIGEEDLLSLPIVAFYPDGTVVFYGQPNEGLVIVTPEKARDKSKEMLKQIGITSLP
ncbi:MAG: GTP-dependent dephospho-CoA kinase family protein [Nitrososphaerales archaeon]